MFRRVAEPPGPVLRQASRPPDLASADRERDAARVACAAAEEARTRAEAARDLAEAAREAARADADYLAEQNDFLQEQARGTRAYYANVVETERAVHDAERETLRQEIVTLHEELRARARGAAGPEAPTATTRAGEARKGGVAAVATRAG